MADDIKLSADDVVKIKEIIKSLEDENAKLGTEVEKLVKTIDEKTKEPMQELSIAADEMDELITQADADTSQQGVAQAKDDIASM